MAKISNVNILHVIECNYPVNFFGAFYINLKRRYTIFYHLLGFDLLILCVEHSWFMNVKKENTLYE